MALMRGTLSGGGASSASSYLRRNRKFELCGMLVGNSENRWRSQPVEGAQTGCNRLRVIGVANVAGPSEGRAGTAAVASLKTMGREWPQKRAGEVLMPGRYGRIP